ncbi:MAG: terminase [Clostridia bacterium]|nr:terminase [Clostridia bacterium]
MIGSQAPRLQVEPQRVITDGSAAAMLMEAYGCALDDWQRTVVDCWLGRDAAGAYTTTSAGLAVPRQNGKNTCLEAREFFGMAIRGERILHTAHQVVTAKKSFRRLERMFNDKRHPEVQRLVRSIRYTNGEEAIELENGGSIEFSARSRQRARGFAGVSLVVYDEAQELTDDQVEAIMATLSASATGSRQIIYTGTPPYPGCPGVVFRRRRMICTTEPGPHDAWHEWSVAGESIADIKTDDRTLWYMTNPALGLRLTEDFTAEEQRTMSADGFARERLGWWSPVLEELDEHAISAEAWDACMSSKPKPEGKTAYGVKFTVDGSEVCLCGAVIPAEGPARVSLIQRRPTGQGTQWLADWLNERYSKASVVVIDGRNGVDVLVDKIAGTWRAKNSVKRPNVREIIASVSTLTAAVDEKTVTWYNKQPALRESAVSAVKRPLAGGWAFGGENSAPVEAAALALWGAKTSKRDPAKKMLIG